MAAPGDAGRTDQPKLVITLPQTGPNGQQITYTDIKSGLGNRH